MHIAHVALVAEEVTPAHFVLDNKSESVYHLLLEICESVILSEVRSWWPTMGAILATVIHPMVVFQILGFSCQYRHRVWILKQRVETY